MTTKTMIGVRVDPELIAALDKWAKAEDRSRAYIVGKILERAVQGREREIRHPEHRGWG